MQQRKVKGGEKAKAKRRLPFDPTPQKTKVNQIVEKENHGNSRPVRNVGAPNVARAQPAGGRSARVEESFALNFSTFIEAPRVKTLDDVTVSPASFDLSDFVSESPLEEEEEVEAGGRRRLDQEEEEESADTTSAVAGVSATTFVLENNMKKEVVAAPTVTQQALVKAKAVAVQQRHESEQQLKEVEEKVRKLKLELEKKPSPVAAAPVVVAAPEEKLVGLNAPKQVMMQEALLALSRPVQQQQPPQLSRHATSPALNRDIKVFDAVPPTVSASSTTDLHALKTRREPLDEETKRSRLVGLRALGTTAAANVKHSEPILPAHAPIDAADPKARAKSRPLKVKMLRAVSTLQATEEDAASASSSGSLALLTSPSALVTAAGPQSKPKAPVTVGTVHNLSWPGDEQDAATGTAFIAPLNESTSVQASSSSSEEAEEKPVPVEEAKNLVPVDIDSESMDEDMAVDTTLQESIMPSEVTGIRYSIFGANKQQIQPRAAAPAANLLDVKLSKAEDEEAKQSLQQLETILSDPHLAGLFGEHLKRSRQDALLRLLDDIGEFKGLAEAGERLSLARSICQMYLSESAARENAVALHVVPDSLRQELRKKVRGANFGIEVFEPIEQSIKHHLASCEVQKFVACDLYKTLGFKKGKKGPASKKVSAAEAFNNAPVEKKKPAEASSSENAFAALSKRVEPAAAPVQKAQPAPPQEEKKSAKSLVEAQAVQKRVTIVAPEHDSEDEEEEDSSTLSPVQKVTIVAAAPAAPAPAPVAVVPKQVVAPVVVVAAPVEIVAPPQSIVPAEQENVEYTPGGKVPESLDVMLSDPSEIETFLSFVEESTDKKVAQKAGANVAFLQKVAQFNSAEERERPNVARAIYNSFLVPADPKTAAPLRRDQKGQTDVDVSELRKQQLVSRFRGMLEKGLHNAAPEKGFFDKAARDVEAFMEPAFNKYVEAKKSGSIIVQPAKVQEAKKTAVEPAKKPEVSRKVLPESLLVSAPVAAPVVAAPPPQKASLPVIPSGTTLSQVVEQGPGEIFSAFVTFAQDIGRGDAAQFLSAFVSFKKMEDAAARTRAAGEIMDKFIRKTGGNTLDIPEHIRSGPEVRWNVFSKRNLIKVDFFDSVVGEVIKMLEAGTWSRFLSECTNSRSRSASLSELPAAVSEQISSSSILSESSGLEVAVDESKFGFGATLQRNEIEQEVLRRLREEANDEEDDDGDQDSGVEDSPDKDDDMPKTVAFFRPSTIRPGDLDLSPSTAADLLSRLENTPAADTVIFAPAKRTNLPLAQNVFEERKENPVQQQAAPQPAAGQAGANGRSATMIPIKRTETAPAPFPKKFGGVWPSRSGKMLFSVGLEGKQQLRFVVLKNKSLYVWKSEAEYKKNKDPKTVLDVDNLLRLNIARDTVHQNLIGATKWTLRLHFEGLNHMVCISHESLETLKDWKEALAESAPNCTMGM